MDKIAEYFRRSSVGELIITLTLSVCQSYTVIMTYTVICKKLCCLTSLKLQNNARNKMLKKLITAQHKFTFRGLHGFMDTVEGFAQAGECHAAIPGYKMV